MAGKEGKLKRRRSIPRGCNNNGGSAAEDDDDTVRANPSIRLDFIENTKGATQSLTKCSSDPLTNRNTSNSYPNDGEAPENLKRVALF